MAADRLNLLFILLSALVAYFIPFELLVFSYGFLGPAHYLTQISWMHERKYFLDSQWEALPLVLLAFPLVFMTDQYQHVAAVTFITGLVLFFIKGLRLRLFLISLLSALAYLYQTNLGPNLFLFFLPTLVHVLFFTFMFILNGALERKSPVAYLSLVCLVGFSLFFIFSTGPEDQYTYEDFRTGGISILREDILTILNLSGLKLSISGIAAVGRFVAFAYTFHYLNWFSKTETIGWHRLPLKKLSVLFFLYAVCIGIYLYDFLQGVRVLAWLSVLHVVLEFPLNAKTGQSIIRRLSPGNPFS